MTADHLSDFLSYLEFERSVSPHTVDAYRRDLHQFLSFIDGPIDALRSTHVSQYGLYLSQEGYAPASYARKLSAVKSFLGFLYREGSISTHPQYLIFSPKLSEKFRHTLTESQITQLLEAPVKGRPHYFRDKAVLELLYACGLRISECRDLTQSQIRDGFSKLIIYGKGRKERLVPLGQWAKEALEQYMREERPQSQKPDSPDTVFLNRSGKKLSRQSLYTIVKKYSRLLDLPQDASPHTLRHSFATHLLDGGADLIEVQNLLGHAHISTTQIYTKVSNKQLKSIHKKAHPRS